MAAALLLLTFIFALTYYFHFKIKTTYSYWRNKGIIGPKPEYLIGNIGSLWKKEDSINTLTDKIYKAYPDEKLVGIYQGLTPTLVVRDPALIKEILVKGFSSFTDRGLRLTKEHAYTSLFYAEGKEWVTLRKKFTPLFTIGKLKNMLPLLQTCVDQFIEYVTKKTNHDSEHEVRSLAMKYTTKAITSIGFGVEVDTFSDEISTFEVMANKIFAPIGIRRYAPFLDNIFPGCFDQLNIRVWPEDITRFFCQLVEDVVRDREGKPKVRNDIMDLMVEIREQGKLAIQGSEKEIDFSYELIAAQAIMFYGASFETTSGGMSFLLYELAFNREVQQKCHEEVDRVMEKYNGKLDYDSLKELKYLEIACEEILRMYPVAPMIYRKCISDYKFEDINLTVDKGTKLLIPLLSVQNDAKYFTDPGKFEPERFSAGNKENNDCSIPFGVGPRNCMGLRLGKMQAILGLAYFLRNFQVSPSEKTPKKIIMDPRALTLLSKDGLWLNIEQRTKNIQ